MATLFTQPALLWAALFAAVPLLIHLLLRPRPRRVRFPALALLHSMFARGQRASRLRNLVLLAARMLLLVVAALLLAGPQLHAGGAAGDQPTATVFLLDDSLSLRYHPHFNENLTLLNRAEHALEQALNAAQGDPAGSAYALLTAGAPEQNTGWLPDVDGLHAALRAGTPASGRHARPLGAALRVATELFRSAPQSQHRLIVATDGAASAWRDVPDAALADFATLDVAVLAVADADPSNLALVDLAGPRAGLPATADATLHAAVTAYHTQADVWLTAQTPAGDPLRTGPYPVTSAAEELAALELPPAPPGPQAAIVTLEPDDLLAFDQVRYVTWSSAAIPLVWLLAPEPTVAGADLTAVLVENLLAPRDLPAARQQIDAHAYTPVTVSDAVAARRAADAGTTPALIVVLAGTQLAPGDIEPLRQWVERGATVLLLPASDTRTARWPGLDDLLLAAPPQRAAVTPAVTLRWETAAVDPDLALAQRELGQCGVSQRLAPLELATGVEVLARYTDDVPALVARRLGRGRLLLLTTSPDPRWSELGLRAAGLLSWLHALVRDARHAPDVSANWLAHEPARLAFDGLPLDGLVAVVPLEPASDARWLRLRGGVPADGWPTAAAGLFAVHTSLDAPPAALYAVNWPAAESDLTPLVPDMLRQRLGVAQLTVQTPTAGAVAVRAPVSRWWARFGFGRLLALLLLALFVAELMLASRRGGMRTADLPAAPAPR